MRIDLDKPSKLPFQSSLIYGASRAGKTHFCATFPQVAMLCSQREKGYVTIEHMDRSLWYDPKVPPQIYVVEDIPSMMGHLMQDIIPQLQKGVLRTVCVELTFHADDVMRTMDIDERNGWAKYTNLADHIHRVDKIIKQLPGARIVYNTLALPEDSAKGTSGVLIPGKALAKSLPALCDLSGYMVQEDAGDHVDRVLHLAAYGNYSPGHRYGKKLPVMIRNPVYRDLEDLLQGRATVDEQGVVQRVAHKPLTPLKKVP